MMIGETHRRQHVPPWQESINNPTVQIPSPISSSSSPCGTPHSPTTHYDAVLASLRRYLLLSTTATTAEPPESPVPGEYSGEFDDFPTSEENTDEFFMYEFKVRKCTRARAHDWTECPFAHPGEKARRRDPRNYNYSGTACSDFRKGHCKKGESCEFAHGVFECWLHPSRYRTQACKDGPSCKRRVCFFAHSVDQIRVGSGFASSSPISPNSIDSLGSSLRNLQLNKVKFGSPVFGSSSPKGGPGLGRVGFFSLPNTPTQPRIGYSWEEVEEDEPVYMERVESGRELRTRMFEKLSKENPLNNSSDSVDPPESAQGLDFGWVSDLIK